ncbi:hypothetical protein IAU59_002603 [Kwoniella sp. CBS 9459]
MLYNDDDYVYGQHESIIDLSPREKMALAKARLIAEEKDEARYRRAKKESRKLSYAASLDSEPADRTTSSAGPSRSGSVRSNPASILRRSNHSNSLHPPTSPTMSQAPLMPSSPAPSLPLPPAPLPHSTSSDSLRVVNNLTTDFGPLLPSPTDSSASSARIRRRSSRVRFSDQQLISSPNLLPPVSRASSLKGLRRESSIDGLRADLIQASSSLNRRPSTTSTGSLGRRASTASISAWNRKASVVSSVASSVGSDPFNWATSSYGSRPSYSLGAGSILGDHDLYELGGEDVQDHQGFQPQSLRYPKVPPALSRLSVETTASSVWSDASSMLSSLPSPTLKDTLERSSLGSTHPDSARSSTFSLEARILSVSGADGRKSSFGPSVSVSLRSSASDQDLDSISPGPGSNSSSFSFHLPPRAQTLAYATLLPRRRSSLLAQSTMHGLPQINRGEWVDPELGLSPRSGPVKVESLNGSLRAKTRLVEITASPEVPSHSPAENEHDLKEHDKRESITIELSDDYAREVDRQRIDSIDLLPPLPSPTRPSLHTQEHSDTRHQPSRGHLRSESTLSAIMAFPVPPDRQNEIQVIGIESTVADDSTPLAHQVHSMPIQDSFDDDTPMAEKVFKLPFGQRSLELPHTEAFGSGVSKPMTEENVICLNSPFEVVPQGTLIQPLQILSPTPATPPLDSQTAVCDTVELEQPSSPELAEVFLRLPRPRISRSVSEPHNNNGGGFETATDTEESELDVASPLVKVAAKSRILTPRSRLLQPSSGADSTPTRPSSVRSVSTNSVSTISTLSLKSGLGFTSGRGWSGSESEEEEWVSAVRQVALRKASGKIRSPVSSGSRRKVELQVQVTPELEQDNEDTPTHKRFTASTSANPMKTSAESRASAQNRYSHLSDISALSVAISTTTEADPEPVTPLTLEILTPAVAAAALSRTNSGSSSHSLGMGPGAYPWGASSPPDSPIRGLFAASSPTREVFITSFRGDKVRKTKSKTSTISSNEIKLLTSGEIDADGHYGVEVKVMSRPLARRRVSGRRLPTPTREVDGWGEPEILIDEDREHSFEDELVPSSPTSRSISTSGSGPASLRGSISTLSLRSNVTFDNDEWEADEHRRMTIRPAGVEDIVKIEVETPTPRKGSSSMESALDVDRASSPDLWEGMEEGNSIMDEEMPI